MDFAMDFLLIELSFCLMRFLYLFLFSDFSNQGPTGSVVCVTGCSEGHMRRGNWRDLIRSDENSIRHPALKCNLLRVRVPLHCIFAVVDFWQSVLQKKMRTLRFVESLLLYDIQPIFDKIHHFRNFGRRRWKQSRIMSCVGRMSTRICHQLWDRERKTRYTVRMSDHAMPEMK